MAQSCPECGGSVVYDREGSELLCVSGGCLWWKDLETGNEYPK